MSRYVHHSPRDKDDLLCECALWLGAVKTAITNGTELSDFEKSKIIALSERLDLETRNNFKEWRDRGLCLVLCLLLIGCRTSPQMPADAFYQTFRTNSELLAPALMSPSTRAEADALVRPKVSLLPPVSKALTSRVVTHPQPTNQVNVTVIWNLEPMPAILQSIQGPTGAVHPVTFLVASTNGWRSQYQVTPDMSYALSNGVVRRMIQNEQMRAGYKFTR